MDNSILEALAAATDPLSAKALTAQTGILRRTLLRRLQSLIERGAVRPIGDGRARRYARVNPPNLADHFGNPAHMRAPVGWIADFLESYVPGSTFYLSSADRHALRARSAPAKTVPAGTYGRRILDRMLIDLSWSSSHLEGNTYSLLDTDKLLLRGGAPVGYTDHETQMVLNHKAAIEFLVESGAGLELTPMVIRNLHALLADNLLADVTAEGRLRRAPVQISGSSYIPLADPHRIANAFETVLAKARQIEDPFEASFFVLVHLPYLQPFIDVNKRVARLAANIPFVRRGMYPLSFLDTPRDVYLSAVLAVYELNDTGALAALFVRAYLRGAEKYAVIAESQGDPDPMRLKYRAELKEVVAYAVRNLVSDGQIRELADQLELTIAEDDAAQFQLMVQVQLESLHEGNFARYRLRPSEFQRWARRHE